MSDRQQKFMKSGPGSNTGRCRITFRLTSHQSDVSLKRRQRQGNQAKAQARRPAALSGFAMAVSMPKASVKTPSGRRYMKDYFPPWYTSTCWYLLSQSPYYLSFFFISTSMNRHVGFHGRSQMRTRGPAPPSTRKDFGTKRNYALSRWLIANTCLPPLKYPIHVSLYLITCHVMYETVTASKFPWRCFIRRPLMFKPKHLIVWLLIKGHYPSHSTLLLLATTACANSSPHMRLYDRAAYDFEVFPSMHFQLLGLECFLNSGLALTTMVL